MESCLIHLHREVIECKKRKIHSNFSDKILKRFHQIIRPRQNGVPSLLGGISFSFYFFSKLFSNQEILVIDYFFTLEFPKENSENFSI